MESSTSQTPVLNNSAPVLPEQVVPEQPFTEPPQVPNRKPPVWLWGLLALFLAGGGTALWRLLLPGQAPPQTAVAQGPPPRPVETVALSSGNGVRAIQLLGQVEASEQATVRSQTSGLVQQVLVQSGDRVTPGMTVAVLDDADQQLALAEAQARLAQQRSELARLEVGTRSEIIAQQQAALRSAQAREQEALDQLKRTEELVQEGAFSERSLVEAKANLDNAQGDRLRAEAVLAEGKAGPIREEIEAQQANVAAAQAAVNQARLALERTRITALSDGIVRTRNVSVGDYVEGSDPVLTLVDSSKLDVFLEVPENVSGSVTSGTTVILKARALPNWEVRTTITAVVPAAESASRRQMVRVRLDNPPAELLPGMAIAGELQLQTSQPGFVVSRDALVRRADQWLLFTVANGAAKQVPVEVIADMGEKMAISSTQLQTGQPIVVRGGDGLADGAPVQVVNQ